MSIYVKLLLVVLIFTIVYVSINSLNHNDKSSELSYQTLQKHFLKYQDDYESIINFMKSNPQIKKIKIENGIIWSNDETTKHAKIISKIKKLNIIIIRQINANQIASCEINGIFYELTLYVGFKRCKGIIYCAGNCFKNGKIDKEIYNRYTPQKIIGNWYYFMN